MQIHKLLWTKNEVPLLKFTILVSVEYELIRLEILGATDMTIIVVSGLDICSHYKDGLAVAAGEKQQGNEIEGVLKMGFFDRMAGPTHR